MPSNPTELLISPRQWHNLGWTSQLGWSEGWAVNPYLLTYYLWLLLSSISMIETAIINPEQFAIINPEQFAIISDSWAVNTHLRTYYFQQCSPLHWLCDNHKSITSSYLTSNHQFSATAVYSNNSAMLHQKQLLHTLWPYCHQTLLSIPHLVTSFLPQLCTQIALLSAMLDQKQLLHTLWPTVIRHCSPTYSML